ncbi:hypothetical protein L2E82_09817 [Cichorium intybus]|uniref:Uncharacterized protein n=1 Tax=Cichorium intybus TaxID=13427 RepID=A0ACB9GA97_CICIN|nr:hypothetical protein L2E82_09817 [Cichorium intybus]
MRGAEGGPELQASPEIFYDDLDTRKYTSSSHSAELSEKALELLAFPDDDFPRLLLDIGCRRVSSALI